MRAGVILDSSAVIAILFNEVERLRAVDEILTSEKRLISAFSFLETSLVTMSRRGLAGKSLLDGFLRDSRVETVELNTAQAEIARDAWYDFGKGRHPAGLNIGDCCSYALARSEGLPLLYKGEDFRQTDIEGIELRGDSPEASERGSQTPEESGFRPPEDES